MATTIYSGEPDTLPVLERSGMGIDANGSATLVYPDPVYVAPGYTPHYWQKCLDSVTGIWTPWYTAFQDLTGISYPSPPGFDAATYRVISTTYGP